MQWKNNKGIFENKSLLSIASIAMLTLAAQTNAEQPEQLRPKSEIVVPDLVNPSDFSVTPDGKTIFVAEPQLRQIRRIKGDSDEIVISGIEQDNVEATSISLFAIDESQILVGVAGFAEPTSAIALFNLSSAETLPLDFIDDFVPPSRNFRRATKREDAFDVLKIFKQQRGVSFVRKFGDAKPELCDVYFNAGVLESLEDQTYRPEIFDLTNLSTLTVDPLGGYYVAISPAQDSTSTLIFSQAEGVIMQQFSLDLPRVTSLAFTSQSQQLYGLAMADESKSDEKSIEAGIYKILATNDGCSAELMMPVDSPIKLEIDSQGNAWVLCKSSPKKSHILKVTGLK